MTFRPHQLEQADQAQRHARGFIQRRGAAPPATIYQLPITKKRDNP
jgi:hypothetical protein